MTTTLSSTMPTSRRDATRSMLVGEAAAAGAEARGTEARGRGHVRARRRPLRVGLLGACTAVVAAATVVAVVVAPGAEPAYAAWTAVPQTSTGPGGQPREDDLQAWASRCTDLEVGGVSVEGLEDPGDADERTVLVDRRGSYTFCVDVGLGSGTEADPLVALAGLRSEAGPTAGLTSMGATVTSDAVRAPAGDEVLVLGGDTTTPPPDPEEQEGVVSLDAYLLYGLAGSDVTGVDVVLTDGLRVSATLTDGLWGLWWPVDKGDPTGSRVEIRTSEGLVTARAADLLLPL